ncbi:MAG: c-type cytochrome biogenesis protein CcmI [Gammaproteobacteria bacterium]|nr:c-type cytochrome biogenesis protein CcmI [Gammaproteobacteria bacterium]
MFWIVILVLMVLAIGWPLYHLLELKHKASRSARSLNLAIHRDRLEELKRDLQAGTLLPAQFEEAKQELAASLLQDIKVVQAAAITITTPRKHLYTLAGATVLIIAGLSLGVFWYLNSQIIFQDVDIGNNTPVAQSAQLQVGPLEKKLRKDINNPALWESLGQTYVQMGRPDAAEQAYARASALGGESVNLLLQQAQVIALSQQGSFEGQPATLAARALELEPNNPRALVFSGLVQMERGQYDYAISLWQRARMNMDENAPQQANLSALIAQAESKKSQGILPTSGAGQPVPLQPPQSGGAVSSANTSPPAGKARLDVTVELSPSLQKKAKPTDSVFIFAKAVNGPSMPLAVLRRSVSDLPLVMTLDDSNAMTADLRLSQFNLVNVVARISLTGEVMAQPGDLYGETGPINPSHATNVKFTINKIVTAEGASAPHPGSAAMAAAPPLSAEQPAAPTGAAGSAQLQVRVSLAPALAKQVQAGETLFIFARAANGPPMPLAVVRKTVADLPLSLTLDDSTAMSPQLRLSQFNQVKIVARVSRSGAVTAQSGDLFGEIGPLDPHKKSKPLAITINQKVP